MSPLADVQTALMTAVGGRLRDGRIIRRKEFHCAASVADLPGLAECLRARFRAELVLMVAADRRSSGDGFHVHYLFAPHNENWLVHATVALPARDPALVSLATFHYPASRFEREIADLFGIPAAGHPDPRPLVRHGFWPEDYFPLRKDAGVRPFRDDGHPFPFQQVGGEGVYEIPVGPVHAGVIEPGHFRFSVVGETIIDMKSRLYFTHKGTEKLFEGREPGAGVELAERVSGDTTIVGHALAYCQALEALAGVEIPARARYLRVVLLEMERLYNHIADFGMIANDTGFAAAHSHCFRIRERLLRLNKRLTGNRLLRGALVPGGLVRDVPTDLDLVSELEATLADFNEIVEITLSNTLVADRHEGTGHLTTQTARDHGVLGFVARASGLDIDARRDHPFAAYEELVFRVPVLESGDVKARTLVRVEEVHEAVGLIRQALERMGGGPLAMPLGPLPAFEPAFTLVEGWRGEIFHWVRAAGGDRLARCKVKDPSLQNWPALSEAIH